MILLHRKTHRVAEFTKTFKKQPLGVLCAVFLKRVKRFQTSQIVWRNFFTSYFMSYCLNLKYFRRQSLKISLFLSLSILKKSSFFKSTSVLCIYFYGRKECIRNDKIKTNITVYDDKNLNGILLMYKLFLNRIPKSNNAYLLEKKPF